MFRFVSKTLIHHHRTKDSKTTHIFFLRTLSSSLKSISNPTNQHSFTVSYLMNSCGLSLESAISASNMINIESTERPDSVLELLRTHGFAKTHIASLISKLPSLILANPEKTLRPKIEFFESLGILGPVLPRIICSDKSILQSSLKNQIIPTIDFLKGFIETNENLIYALKQSSRVIRCNFQKVMVPNISTLRAHGVPESHIAKLIKMQPRSLMLRIDLFKEVVNALKEMGFDPTRRSFLLAIRSMTMNSKLNWEKKKDLLMSFGWSEEEFRSAFNIQPMFMLSSEKKIGELMDYFENEVGLKPSEVAKCPNLFLTSLERRIIPRCSVLQVLMVKGLIKKDIDVVWVLNKAKKPFEAKFVFQYKEKAPEVIKAYKGEMGFQ